MFVINIQFVDLDNGRTAYHETFPGAIKIGSEMLNGFVQRPKSIDIYEVAHKYDQNKRLVASLRTIT